MELSGNFAALRDEKLNETGTDCWVKTFEEVRHGFLGQLNFL